MPDIDPRPVACGACGGTGRVTLWDETEGEYTDVCEDCIDDDDPRPGDVWRAREPRQAGREVTLVELVPDGSHGHDAWIIRGPKRRVLIKARYLPRRYEFVRRAGQ